MIWWFLLEEGEFSSIRTMRPMIKYLEYLGRRTFMLIYVSTITLQSQASADISPC
jgi:hypothetical protein